MPPGQRPQGIALAEIDSHLPAVIEPILKGRHLISMGYTPGPQVGAVLKEAFQAQLEERFHDIEGALAWHDEYIRTHSV